MRIKIRSALLTVVCFVSALCTSAQTNNSSTININIFGGTAPFNNVQWNNWNLTANRISPVLKYADGSNSTVTITSSIALGITDNGTPYPTTMCPPEVGRFAMLSSTSAHTLTFSNLKNDGTIYDLEIYASRRNTGNITRFTINNTNVDINTASNFSNAAIFNGLVPNSSRQIVITITRAAGTYAYVNGLKLVERSARNQAPAVNAGVNQTITLPVNTVSLNGTATDADGTIASRLWSKISGPDAFTITSPNTLQTTITGLTEGIYEFELAVTDDDGDTGKDTVRVTVNPAPPNIPPAVNAGANQTITLPINSVTLNGTANDSDGSVATRLWSKISGPSAFTITSPTSLQTTVTGLAQGIYEFELAATDDDGATTKDTVTVTVNPEPLNNPPSVNAGTNQTITLPLNSSSLNGTATDNDGTVTTILWSKISGPSAFTITSPTSLQSTVTGLVQGIYEFELAATDDDGATTKDTVTVAVNAASYSIPFINAGNGQTITFPESAVSVTSAYTVTGASLKTLRWSKTKVPGQQSKKVVWIGSSTLAGTGATTNDSAVVWRVGNYYSRMGIMSSWLNLAVGGSNIFHGMPTGYTPSGNQNAPDVNNNVTAALNQGADIVIVGYPSNAYDGPLSITEIMFAYRTIYNTVVNAGKKCYIMTSQPRPAFGTAGRNMLKQVADSIMAQFPDNYIQAYYSQVQTGTHNLLYNSGDNIHLNNTGHRVLFNSVVARNMFETWTNSSAALATPTESNTSVTGLITGTHIFQVSITDTHEQSATDTVIITVKPEPGVTANAGADQNLTLPASSVTLNGSASEGGVSFAWRQLTGPASTSIANASAAITTVTGITIAGTYSFELSLNGGASRDTVLVTAVTPGSNGKIINVNIFGGTNPFNNTQWNNWNVVANRISPLLKYADGASSPVTITSSISLSVTDNGTPYPTTMCPPEVGRYAMLSSTGAHTLIFSNLKTDGTVYDLEIYASRRNTGNITRFTVNGRAIDINTASNYSNAARFMNLQPNAMGQIVITITRAAGTYAYVNGLKLTEIGIIYVAK